MIYLDASAFVSLFVTDAHSGRIRGLLRTGHPSVAVSTFGLIEFAAAVSTRDRAGRLAFGQAATILLQADAWIAAQATTVEVEPADHRVAAAMSAASSSACGRRTRSTSPPAPGSACRC